MKKILSVMAFVAVLAAPASAFAAVNGPTTSGGSDWFVAVTNNATGASAVIDLGVSASTPLTGTFTLDAATINALGSSSALTWQIFANVNTAAAAGTVLYTTWDPTSTAPSTSLAVANNISAINNWFTTNSANFAAASGLQTATSSGLSSWSQTTNVNGPGATYGLAGVNAQAAVGSSLYLYSFTATTARGAATTSGPIGASPWTLTGNVLSNTPIPAAAWLLVSGLLGFGGVSRRRRQTLAA